MKKILLMTAVLVLAGCGKKKGRRRRPIPPAWRQPRRRHRHGRHDARQHDVVRLARWLGTRPRSKLAGPTVATGPRASPGPVVVALSHPDPPGRRAAPPPWPAALRPAARRPPPPRGGSTPGRCARSSSLERSSARCRLPARPCSIDRAVERLAAAPAQARAAPGWCGRGNAAGPPSPARYNSPWCTIRRRSGRSALPAAGCAHRSRRRARASRRGSGRRAGRRSSPGRAPAATQPAHQRLDRRRPAPPPARRTARSPAPAPGPPGSRSPPTEATRPADSGVPTPDSASTWKPWAPSSQATRASPVRSATRASRGGSWRRNSSSEAARPDAGHDQGEARRAWRSTQ